MLDAQVMQQRLVFQALGDRSRAEAVRHLDDRANDRGIFWIDGEIPDKGLVDLQLVDLEALQVGQAQISGAEVIDR